MMFYDIPINRTLKLKEGRHTCMFDDCLIFFPHLYDKLNKEETSGRSLFAAYHAWIRFNLLFITVFFPLQKRAREKFNSKPSCPGARILWTGLKQTRIRFYVDNVLSESIIVGMVLTFGAVLEICGTI